MLFRGFYFHFYPTIYGGITKGKLRLPNKNLISHSTALLREEAKGKQYSSPFKYYENLKYNAEKIGERIEELCENYGVSYQFVADKCNIHYKTLEAYRKGERTIPIDVLFLIAETLHTTVSFIIGETDGSPKSKTAQDVEVLKRLLEEKQKLLKK